MLRAVILSISVVSLGGCATEDRPITFFSLLPPPAKDLAGPANLPPDGWESEFWVDRRGCAFVATQSGEWVPQLNLNRTRKCDPSLAWEPIDFSNQPQSEPTPSESVDPITGVITRVLPPKPIPPSFVQVAFFENHESGLAVRQRFIDLGFPVVGSDTTPTEGKGVTLVLGPFTEAGLLQDGLDTARDFGFDDADTFQN